MYRIVNENQTNYIKQTDNAYKRQVKIQIKVIRYVLTILFSNFRLCLYLKKIHAVQRGNIETSSSVKSNKIKIPFILNWCKN